MTSKITNLALSDDAREWFITINVPTPEDSEKIKLVLKSPFEFEILEARHILLTGTLDALIEAGGTPVQFSGGNTDESIPATTVEAAFSPDGTTPNHTVALNDTLEVTTQNVSTDADRYALQLHLRRTALNF